MHAVLDEEIGMLFRVHARVWFDEKLIKGNWAPAGMPRVIVYSSETDEQ